MQQPAWLDAAWAELGIAEQSGARSNPRIKALFRDAGHPEVGDDAVAWCAAFVGACLARAGLQSTGSLLARSYLQWGRVAEEPRLGAIAVLERGSDERQGHVGFVVGVAGSRILLLGGNQGNAVSVEAFERAHLIGLRWPVEKRVDAAPGNPAGFERALVHVLEMEGGWSNDPHDPGGPTNKGITLAVFADHLRRDVRPETVGELIEELRRIPDVLVAEIYRHRYWEKASCGDLPAPLAMFHFDAAVNHGVGGAVRMLQQTLDVTADGEVGPITLAAAEQTPPAVALERYAEIRRQRYRALPHFWRFGRGWLRRVDVTLARALAIQSATTTPVPARPAPQITGEKAMSNVNSESNTNRGAKWWGESVTVWGALITAIATVLPVVGPMFGLDITGALARQIGEEVVKVLQAAGGLAGTLAVIWGRTRAETRLVRKEMTIHL